MLSGVSAAISGTCASLLTVCFVVCTHLNAQLGIGCFQGVFDVSLESSGILWPKVGYSFDTSLVFCYANSVVQPPNEDIEGDYRCVELFKVPAGRLFRDVLLENCTTFQLPQEPEERLQAETRTNSRFLWHSVPSTLRERSEWWGESVA